LKDEKIETRRARRSHEESP